MVFESCTVESDLFEVVKCPTDVVTQPKEHWPSLEIEFTPGDASSPDNMQTVVELVLVTNLTTHKIPLVVYHGRLEVLFGPLEDEAKGRSDSAKASSSKSNNNHGDSSPPKTVTTTGGGVDGVNAKGRLCWEEGNGELLLDYAVVGVKQKRTRTLNLTNPNPIPIPLMSVTTALPSLEFELLRVVRAPARTLSRPVIAAGEEWLKSEKKAKKGGKKSKKSKKTKKADKVIHCWVVLLTSVLSLVLLLTLLLS